MTGMPISITNPVSLADVIDFLSREGIDNPSIWAHFDTTDKGKLATLCAQLDAVEMETYAPAVHIGKTKKAFESEKNGKKGKLFEEITSELMSGLTCFGVRKDVTTATNQLDLLVQIQPSAMIVPAFRMWGTHFICECKFHDSGVKVDWVQKLHSLLTLHGANVGVLISKKGSALTGRGVNIKHMVQLIAIQNRYILNITREDLDHCIKNGGLLQMLVDKFVAIQSGISTLLSHK